MHVYMHTHPQDEDSDNTLSFSVDSGYRHYQQRGQRKKKSSQRKYKVDEEVYDEDVYQRGMGDEVECPKIHPMSWLLVEHWKV